MHKKQILHGILITGCTAAIAALFFVQARIALQPPSIHFGTKAPLASAYAEDITEFCDELEGYWKFDEGTGTDAADSTANDHDGILVGYPTWSSSVPTPIDFVDPYAIYLDGDNDRMLVASPGNLNITGDLTISLWVMPSTLSTGSGNNTLVTFGSGSEAATANDSYRFSINSDNKLQLYWEHATGADDSIVSTTAATMPLLSWKHLAVTRDATNNEVKFYASGSQVGSTITYENDATGGTDGVFMIGADPASPTVLNLNGVLDDVRVYTKVLTGAQILTLAQGTDDLAACTCGDIITQSHEECDDGNTVSTDSCNNFCQTPTCGNSITDGSDECDNGSQNANTASCTSSCQSAECGDGYVQTSRGEECEPPGTATCASNCLGVTSGGGSTGGGGTSGGGSGTTGGTGGGGNSSTGPKASPPPGCGNYRVQKDLGEECDEGRQNGKGSCSYECKMLWCGDGVVSPENKEECEPPVIEVIDGIPRFEERTCGTGVSCSIPQRDPRTNTIIGGCRRVILQPCDAAEEEPPQQTTTQETLVTCGNFAVETGEDCDAGGVCIGGELDGTAVDSPEAAAQCNTGGGDIEPLSQPGCSTCFFEYCGDGVVQESGPDGEAGTADDEDCDNGSRCSVADNPCRYDEDCPTGEMCIYAEQLDPKCSSICQREQLCGDGAIDQGERCDDGNRTSGDGCSATCAIEVKKDEVKAAEEVREEEKPEPRCGDGTLDDGETCDDGNLENADGCDERCAIELPPDPRCGDGTTDQGEACDDGDRNADDIPGTCRTNCQLPACGDRVVDPSEECDVGEANDSETADRCRRDCRLPWCGDGVVDSSEQCDPSAVESDSSVCSDTCVLIQVTAACGDGERDAAEECDDGNRTNGDGCSAICDIEVWVAGLTICGNGIRETNEECDDGNRKNLDGCDQQCTLEPVASLTEQPLPPTRYPSVEPVLPQTPIVASLLPLRYTPPPTPVAQTGPAALVAVAIGAAGGWSSLRLRRKKRK